jgi:hypothetical protein
MTGSKLANWRAGKGDKAKKRNTAVGQVVDRNIEFGRGKVFGSGKGKEKAFGNTVCVDGYEAASDKRVRNNIFPTNHLRDSDLVIGLE